MSEFYPTPEIKQFLEMLSKHPDGKLYPDLLEYPTLLEELYYAEMTRDYALTDWNNSPEDITLKNNYTNSCKKHRSLLEKKNIVFDKLVRLMTTF